MAQGMDEGRFSKLMRDLEDALAECCGTAMEEAKETMGREWTEEEIEDSPLPDTSELEKWLRNKLGL